MSLSQEDISIRTKIQLAKIAALEHDAYDQLPAGIYLDGIVTAYARQVGVDSEAFVARVRTLVSPPPAVTLEHIAAVRHPAPADRRRRTEGMTVAHGMTVFAAVAVLLAVAGFGVQLFPGVFTTAPQQASLDRTPLEPEPDRTREGDSPRSERGTSGSEPIAEPPGVIAEPAPVVEPVAVAEPAPPATIADVAAVTPRVALEAVAPAETRATPRNEVVRGPAAAPVSTLTGVWTLETEIESSSLKAFEGLRLGYLLELRQEGDRIEGTGQKVAENGVPLKGARRTPITVHGTLGEGRVRLTFGEQGARRRTTGRLNLVIDDSGVLRGGFASDAAHSAGAAHARRL